MTWATLLASQIISNSIVCSKAYPSQIMCLMDSLDKGQVLRKASQCCGTLVDAAPLHRPSTFVSPLSDQKNDQDAQWYPIPRKFCFCVTAAARPLIMPSLNDQSCCIGTTGRAMEAECIGITIARVAQGLPWSPNRGTAVVTVIAQWTLLVGQRRHNGVTWEAEVSLKLIQNVYNSMHFYGATNDRPLCIHSATTTMRLPSSCLLWATRGRPTSSATFVRLFWTCSKLHGDHGVHGEVCMPSEPPLNDQGKLSAMACRLFCLVLFEPMLT